MHACTRHSTGTPQRDGQGWRCLPWSLAVGMALGLALATPPRVQARTFQCGAGDVDCLIAAINTANANGQANTIRLAAGTYTLTEAYNETPPDPNGLNGLPVVTSPLTIQGARGATTIIERGASAEAFRLLKIAATGTLTLTGLTLRGGGGIFFHSGGGGIANVGTLTLTNSTLADNHSLFFGGGISNGGTLTLTNSTLTGNGASSGGGGIANVGTLTLTNSALTGNGGGDDGGGGIFNRGTATLTNSTLTGNGGDGGGGGILNDAGTVTLTNSTLTDNVAGLGGGIFNGGTLTLTNCTLAHNFARFFGDAAGGIYNSDGSATLQNTILALNTSADTSPHADDCVGVVTSLGNNLIGDPTGCTITGQSSDLKGDPGLDTFTDNGRPGTGHVPLLPTSRAIDAGNDAGCPRRDQLGRPRVNIPRVGTSFCDIGAIEFRPGGNAQPDAEPATAAQVTP